MKTRLANWTGLWLVVMLTLGGCLKPLTGAGSIGSVGSRMADSEAMLAAKPLVGQVESFKYQVQSSSIADIAAGSLVGLIDSTTNRTIATTVTQPNGSFTLNFGNDFRPGSTVYYLEAYKGLPVGGTPNRAGVSMARVRTLVQYVGGSWRSLVASGNVSISVATTALSVITSLRSASDSTRVDPLTLLSSLQPTTPLSFNPGSSGVSVSEFQTVSGMVSQALTNDDDPMYRITYDLAGQAFFLVDRGVALTSVTPVSGPMGTAVTIQGTSLGLSPVVRFNGTVASSSVNSISTQIAATVPIGATSGPVTVQVGTIVFNGANFSVTPWDGHNVFDGAGNMYVASSLANRIYRFDPQGRLSVFSADPLLNYPRGVLVDPAGNVYVANWNDSKILKIAPSGVATVLASGNGLANPVSLAMNGGGDLFVSNWNGANILKIASGSSTPTVYATGAFNAPYGEAFDQQGNLYVANWNSGNVVKVTPTGQTSTVMSGLPTPAGVCLDSSGNIYVACYGGHNIYKLTPSGGIGIFAATPNYPGSIAINPNGNVYVASYYYDYIQRLDSQAHTLGYWSSGHLTWGLKADPVSHDLYVTSGMGWGAYTRTLYRVPYNGTSGSYDTPVAAVTGLPNPSAVALAGNNVAYVGDWSGMLFRANLGTGTYTTVAGGLGAISDVTLDGSGNVYTAGWDSHAVYRLANGTITGRFGFSWYYNNAAFGPDGYLYVPDFWQGKILRVSPSGVITTYCDNGGSGFGNPHGLTFDSAGNMYVSSWSWNTIYKVATGSLAVSTYAGGMSQPNGLGFDNAGNLYVANWSDKTIKKVDTGRTVTTLATLSGNPRGLAVDKATGTCYAPAWDGNVYRVTASGSVSTYGSGVGNAMQGMLQSNGDLLVASYSDGRIYRIPAGGGAAQLVAGVGISLGGVAQDSAGNLYALCWDAPNIYRIPAGTTTPRLFAASLRTPAGVYSNAAGTTLYVTDWSNGVLYKVDTTTGAQSIAANSADWTGSATSLKGIVTDGTGAMYVSSWGNGVWKLDPNSLSSATNSGVARYGDNNSSAGILGGIDFGANGNLYGTTWEWVNNGCSPITFIPAGGGNGTNMSNWPRYIAF